jgi:nucleotide-binding universal stress UspA family protein
MPMASGRGAAIEEILLATDLSPESERAFEHARFLAERFRATLTLYHVVEAPPREYLRLLQGQADEVFGPVEEAARRRLEQRSSVLTVPHHVVVEREAAAGLVDVALIELVRRSRPDLTVMAARVRKGFASFFLGSVTQQVVQHAKRPVLCVRRPPRSHGLPYRRILVPTDLSDASRRAFALAALLARSMEAPVIGLHVCTPPAATAVIPGPVPPGVPTQEEVRRFFQPEMEGVELSAEVYVSGAPWNRIAKVAEEKEADLIVMSTQGHDSIRDEIIGSNTERVLRHAPCSVLVA